MRFRMDGRLWDVKPGDVVCQDSFGGLRLVRVTAVHEDVANGMPGFDGVVLGGPHADDTVWGYMYQLRDFDAMYRPDTRPNYGGVR